MDSYLKKVFIGFKYFYKELKKYFVSFKKLYIFAPLKTTV
ncbi:hypothetical protein J2T03_001059 [Chryseobacterium lathyri]|nr:hypothetical protein [Chryseobacterium lathyri]